MSYQTISNSSSEGVMAFFFRLQGKVYKTTNKVTIGRGTPFEDLDENREISRNHCKVINKKGHFYIKRIDKNSKVLINGKEIPSGSFIKVGCDDKLYLADLELELLSSYEKKDYIVVKRFYSPFAATSKMSFVKTGALISICLFVVMSFVIGSFELKAVLFNMGMALFTGFLNAAVLKVISKLFGRSDEVVVNEVILGKAGLTLHYRKSSMSILFSNIDRIYRKRDVICIHAHSEKFLIYLIKDLDNLYSDIIKSLPDSIKNKKQEEEPPISYKTAWLTLCLYLTISIFIYYFTNTWGKEELNLIVGITIFSISFLLGKKPLTPANSKNLEGFKKQRLMTAICGFLTVIGLGSDYITATDTQERFKKCVDGNTMDCKLVNFSSLQGEFGEHSKELRYAMKRICKVDPTYCEKRIDHTGRSRKGRKLASEDE